MKKKIWIDMINPSHPLFFRPLVYELKKKNTIDLTIRNRGETVKLAEQFGLNGNIYGNDYEDSLKKMISISIRTVSLSYKIKNFDYSISFENPMSVLVSKLRGKKSILLLDNDLKYKRKGVLFQDIESKIKLKADTIIMPLACEQTFVNYYGQREYETYDGYKEDFYIADFHPDKRVFKKIGCEDFVVLRGEAFCSFYVNNKNTILPQLFDLFKKENINVLFLPRDKSDLNYKKHSNVFSLDEPLNGLDLIYYSNAVLTGSGTMAREAACMGKPAISFFPDNDLLSVDLQLINEGKILHSRNPQEIVEYVLKNNKKNKIVDMKRSKNVKSEILKIINEKLN